MRFGLGAVLVTDLLLLATPAAMAGPPAPDDAAPAPLDQKTMVPGHCFHSKKLHQVACVNATLEEDGGRSNTLEIFGEGGATVKSLGIDAPGRPGARQDPGRLKRPNEVLLAGEFAPVADEVLDAGGASGLDLPALGAHAEVRDDLLLVTLPKAKNPYRVRLPVRRPDSARFAALSYLPGTRVVAFTFVVTSPEPGAPTSWMTVIVKVP